MKIKLLIAAILLAAPTVAHASVVGRGPTGTDTLTGAQFADPTGSVYHVMYYCAKVQPQMDWANGHSGVPYVLGNGAAVVMVPRYCRGA